ncbi:hypothetical protein HDE_02102 [Halotydeus destructor]|nr:hypothetical protein HDE_02102 [Halotydeus destructor]
MDQLKPKMSNDEINKFVDSVMSIPEENAMMPNHVDSVVVHKESSSQHLEFDEYGRKWNVSELKVSEKELLPE